MKATCPKDSSHNRFTTTAHVMEEWVVNESGDYIETRQGLSVDHGPDPGNNWQCLICGAYAKVE